MKHRRNKVKREHGIIENALQWLESLSNLAEVTDIIPGVIDVKRSPERGIFYKYKTQTGCKLLLKSNGSIQEAFVVTKYPERVQEWVTREFPPDSPTPIANLSIPDTNNNLKKKITRVTSKPKVKLEFRPSPQEDQSKKQKRLRVKVHKANYNEVDDMLNVAERLDNTTLKALKQFKKSLEEEKSQNLKAKGKRNTKI